MTSGPEPGDPLASGRAADVFDLGDGTVLRRYRGDRDCELEGRVMAWAADHGIPVPAVHRASGRDLEMDLVLGPTMLADLEQRPWRLGTHARTLARIQRAINAVPAPRWLGSADEHIPDGDALLHLDLHPMNVLLAPTGPVVIDWTNASRGDPDMDASTTYVLMSTFEATSALERIGRSMLVRAFARARGRPAVRARLPEACARRLTDPNVTPGERIAVEALARRSRT